MDAWVLAFTVGLVVTTLLFGLAPAISGTRLDLRNALQSAAMRMSSGREQRVLRTCAAGDGGRTGGRPAGLCRVADAQLHARDELRSGFDESNTLTAVTSLHTGVVSMSGGSTAWQGDASNFADQLLLRLQALPGVKERLSPPRSHWIRSTTTERSSLTLCPSLRADSRKSGSSPISRPITSVL